MKTIDNWSKKIQQNVSLRKTTLKERTGKIKSSKLGLTITNNMLGPSGWINQRTVGKWRRHSDYLNLRKGCLYLLFLYMEHVYLLTFLRYGIRILDDLFQLSLIWQLMRLYRPNFERTINWQNNQTCTHNYGYYTYYCYNWYLYVSCAYKQYWNHQ